MKKIVEKIGNESAIKKHLNEKLGITQNEGESVADFAKRARIALLAVAQSTRTASVDPTQALNSAQTNPEFQSEVQSVQNDIEIFKRNLPESASQSLSPEQINSIAAALVSKLTIYTASAGIAAADKSALLEAMGQSITGENLGNIRLIGADV